MTVASAARGRDEQRTRRAVRSALAGARTRPIRPGRVLVAALTAIPYAVGRACAAVCTAAARVRAAAVLAWAALVTGWKDGRR